MLGVFLSRTSTKMRVKCVVKGHNAVPPMNTVNSEIIVRVLYFRETSHMQRFVIITPSRNGDITLSFTVIGKSCPSGEFVKSQICLSALFAKISLAKISKFTVLFIYDEAGLIMTW